MVREFESHRFRQLYINSETTMVIIDDPTLIANYIEHSKNVLLAAIAIRLLLNINLIGLVIVSVIVVIKKTLKNEAASIGNNYVTFVIVVSLTASILSIMVLLGHIEEYLLLTTHPNEWLLANPPVVVK